MQTRILVAALALALGTARAENPLAPFITVDAPVTALTHVKVDECPDGAAFDQAFAALDVNGALVVDAIKDLPTASP